ncbi:MAG: hypothetical protein J7L54_03750 [Elusimicrobia bacterium]|nr:hypothetical protein [Elusimicrobiota bacterium]
MRRIQNLKFKIKEFFFLSGLVVFLSSCGGPLQYNKRGDIFYEQGKYSLAAQQYRKNKKYCESVNYPIYILNLAVADYRAGNLDESERAFLAALKLSRGENLNTVEKNFGFLAPKSERMYKLRPFEEVIARFYLALIYLQKGLLEDAVVEFKKINLIDDQYPLIHYIMGKSYEAKGEYDDAEIEYRKTINLRGDIPYPYLDLYEIYRRRNWNDEAEKAKAKFLSLAGAKFENDISTSGSLADKQEIVLLLDLRNFFPQIKKNDIKFFHFEIRIDGKFCGKASLIEDMDFQKMKKRFKKMIKEKLKNAARSAIIGKIFGAAASDNAEYRNWDKIPGAIYIFRTKPPSGKHEIKAILYSQDIKVSEKERDVKTNSSLPARFVFF